MTTKQYQALKGEVKESQHVDLTRFFAAEMVQTAYIQLWRQKGGRDLISKVEGKPENIRFHADAAALHVELKNDGFRFTESDRNALMSLVQSFRWVHRKVLDRSIANYNDGVTPFANRWAREDEGNRLNNAASAHHYSKQVTVVCKQEKQGTLPISILVTLPYLNDAEKKLYYNVLGTLISAVLTHDITYF